MEDVEALDTRESEGQVYVRERAALDKLIQRIGAAERVALDTEADSLHNFLKLDPFVLKEIVPVDF